MSSIKAVQRLMLPLAIGASVVWLMLAGLGLARAQTKPPRKSSTAVALSRPQDPIIVVGAGFTSFLDVPLDELVLYAYQSGVWTPVPFQIDEVNIAGTYVVSDDERLDSNDELVFMASDTGESVSEAIWPADPQSQLYPRYEIAVSDPLSPGDQAWVYLFRSTTLTRSSISYLVWDEPAQTATAISYTAIFTPAEFVGLADLMINGAGVDFLDRQKFRAEIDIFGFIIELNEEFLATLITSPLTLPAVGPVRAVTNDGDLNAAFYGSRIDIDASFDLSAFDLIPDLIRTSFDWNNPITTGITTYHDSNTSSAVTIDGTPDVVSTTPAVDWFQVNGGPGGPGGVVLSIPSVDPSGGTLSNYYKDDGAIDLDDTGDQRSYGDAGWRIDDPGQIVEVTVVAHVLPPGTTANVGAIYFDWVNNPLVAISAEQSFVSAAPDLTITKHDGGIAATPGGLITYTLTFTNKGTRDATGVVITESVPAHTSFNDASPSGWQRVGATEQYTYSVGNLGVGPSQTITFAVTVTDPLPAGVDTITNTARIGDDGTHGRDLDPHDNWTQLDTAVTTFIYLPLIMKDCACP